MTRQDTYENQVKSIYLGIGSNLGNRRKNIEKAKFKLMESNIYICETSGFYESLSWPNKKNPKFLNIVIRVYTKLTPSGLLRLCKEIEMSLGRKKREKNAPRECDIDILDYDKKIMKGAINLPHASMHERNFVLLPLFEINKAWKHPRTQRNIKNLILSLSNRDIRSIKKI